MSDQPDAATFLWGGGLISIGAGGRWLIEKWTKWRASREARLEAREDEYVKKLEARLAAVEGVVTAQGKELESHRVAIAILIAKVAREDPSAPELMQVRDILGSAFPIHVHLPADMREQLASI